MKKRHEFLRIQRSGHRYKTPNLVFISRYSKEPGRFGLTVAKNVGQAHVRNLVKRRLRHIARLRPYLFERQDIVILALPNAANASFQDLEKDIQLAHEGIRSSRRP
ncbi:MAG: ribonuclease P protein component [Myxococcaceae bacterium]|nr:ribonuclease P protein component [Myxococcaceae bacterium]MBH2006746.1 ribonuclease P protein component [Myxococcaceae bacterium]